MTGAIERVCLTHLQIPFKEPFRISGGEVAVKDALLVTVETAHGVGHGESSPMAASFGYSSDTPEGCWADLAERIAPGLLGRRFSAPEDIAALRAGWTGSRFAAAGAETACWDLLGRARHATLADMLGAAPERIALGVESGLAVGLYPTIVELLQTIETHLAEGYRRVKIKIKPGQDVELVRSVRQHFGDIPLMVDANAAYTAADLDVFRALDEFDLLMFEQPMAAADLDGLAALQAAVATPVIKYPTDIEPSARWFVDDYVAPSIELSAPGLFSVPTRPGLGFEVDHAKVRHYQVRQREFTTRTAG
jgi:O-succinylbenzoate synthase